MDRVGTRVVLLGDYGGEGHSSGFNEPGKVSELPRDYSGGIWTNRIDLLAPAIAGRSSSSVSNPPALALWPVPFPSLEAD